MNNINFLQVGEGHCFVCHIDTGPNDNHGIEHIKEDFETKDCNSNCNPKWQKTWDELKANNSEKV